MSASVPEGLADRGPPDGWTAETVLARLIEAADAVARSSAMPGPRGFFSAWPDTVPEADWRRLLKAAENRPADRRTTRRAPPSAAAISRMYETFDWWPLVEDEERRRQLQFRVFAWAGGVKWSAICRTMGWKRNTVDSRITAELDRLAKRVTASRARHRRADSAYAAKAERLLGGRSDRSTGKLDAADSVRGQDGTISATPPVERGTIVPGVIHPYRRATEQLERRARPAKLEREVRRND